MALALIPARGGSKGIPRKNLAPVAGRPLIAWTIDAAQEAASIDRIVVSTDDAEIGGVARSLGAEVLDRPAELAGDETPMLDVLVHAARALQADALVLLQATSPLRRADDIDAAVSLFDDSGADCVVSVVGVPHAYRPGKLVALDGDRVVASGDAPLHRGGPPAYARNGPAVLVVRTAGLARRGLYGGDVRAYVMSADRSLDVDTPDDLRLADVLLRE